jgi:hypothetical protein
VLGLELNQEVVEREASMQFVTGPGLPGTVKNVKEFMTKDCISLNRPHLVRSRENTSLPGSTHF